MKLLLFAVMLAMTIGGASAISILSAGSVDFQSNNNLYDGPAFVIAGVENGGNDIITWEIDDLALELDSGYELTKTGTIRSDFTSEGWTYPISARAQAYDTRDIATIYTWGSESQAISDCQAIGGDALYIIVRYASYTCIDVYSVGYFHDLNSGVYGYEVDYTLSVSGEGSDSFTLTDTTSTGGRMIGSRNWFQAVRQTDGVSPRADPDIDDKIGLFYDLRSGSWRTIIPTYSTNRVSANSAYSFLEDCYDSNIFRPDPAEFCSGEWNLFLNNELNVIRKSQSGVTISASTNSQGQGTGSLKFDDGNIYRNPIVTLTINADSVGVIRNFGEGSIVSVDYPTDMTVGRSYPITITTENVGDASMDASLNFDCSQFSISGISQRYSLNEGQTKTDSGSITFVGGVTGCSSSNTCTLSISNTNAVGVDDTFDFRPEVCQVGECTTQGATQCFTDTIRQCNNVNGVLKYETLEFCAEGCALEEGVAVCTVSGDPVCGNGVCEVGETAGGEFECLLPTGDCTTVTDQGSGSGSALLWIVIVGGVLLIAGAVFVRVKFRGGL